MAIEVVQLNPGDSLEAIVEHINAAQWDEANDLVQYTTDALEAYLQRQDTVFVVAYERAQQEAQTERAPGAERAAKPGQKENPDVFLGMASGRIEIKPYDHERWLYIDEVDVCVDQRKKGAGKAMMRKLFEIAKAADCEEVWLGTEVDNVPANALYRSLNPEEIEQFVGYTF